jgi:hypothetical protein
MSRKGLAYLCFGIGRAKRVQAAFGKSDGGEKAF